MENKINEIIKILNGETVYDCLTILSKVQSRIHDVEYDERQKIVFKI
jgi:hypothetical protein